MPTTWKADHAGTCYPQDPKELLAFFQNALEEEEPTPVPKAPTGTRIWIVPHIDFRVDLTTYASVYRQIARRRTFPRTVFILGVGHRSKSDFSLGSGAFHTPLGRVGGNSALIRRIRQETSVKTDRDPEAYPGEHSLEFVVVWLQALRDLYFPGSRFSVVPVLLGGLPEAVLRGRAPGPRSTFHRFGRTLMDAAVACGSDALVVASIDGCHVGPRFGHPFPADGRVRETVWQWESLFWDACATTELEDCYALLSGIRNGFYFDGVGVLTLLLRHRSRRARPALRKMWFSEEDDSLVTFTSGWVEDIRPDCDCPAAPDG